jgi:hypothetical protein
MPEFPGLKGFDMITMHWFRIDRYVDGDYLPSEFGLTMREFATKNDMYAFLDGELTARLTRVYVGTVEWELYISDSTPSAEHCLIVSGRIRQPRWDADNPDMMTTILAEIVLS